MSLIGIGVRFRAETKPIYQAIRVRINKNMEKLNMKEDDKRETYTIISA